MFYNNSSNPKILCPLLLSLVLTACGGGGGGDTPSDTITAGSGGGSGTALPKPTEGSPGDGGGGDVGDGDVVIDEPPVQDDIVVEQGNFSVLVPGSSLLDVIDVEVNVASVPALPVGYTRVGDAVELRISDAHQELLNGPAQITVTYSDAVVNFEDNLVVLGFDGTDFEPVTVLAQEPAENTITFDTRRIHSYVVAEIDNTLPAEVDTGFMPALNGWHIDNVGTYFAPGGSSFGMAGFAAWFHQHRSEQLNGLYLEETAQIAAARAQLSQAETWGNQTWRNRQAFSDARLALLLRAYLATFNEPLVLMLGETSPTRAVVVYGVDSDGFYFYDPEKPGVEQFVTFDGTKFGNYGELGVLGYAALASFGRNSDFAALAAEADAGFPGSDNISITTPTPGELIDAREATLSGSFLNDLSSEEQLYVEVKGVGRQLTVSNGTFSNLIEISSGTNTIVGLAGVDSALENNWFKDAPTRLLEVTGTLPPAQLLVTLTWEQDETDVDLYITEPGGETSWFGNRQTSNGLELDFDDTNGFGPEHGTLEVGGTDVALEGSYRIRVHYFSDDGLDVAATGRVSIVINEGQENQNTLNLRFRINSDDASASGPDGSGDSWVNIAQVNVLENTIDTDAGDDAVAP